MSTLAEHPSSPSTVAPPVAIENTQGPDTLPASVDWGLKIRLGGLRRFAFAITLLNVLGHFFLGFETSWAHPLAAMATGYSLELLLEWIDSRANKRIPRFRGVGFVGFVDFF